jgi:GDP-D-mannose 3', 5'-epimerase
MAERGYGWEKLVSEMFCREYWEERGLATHIARFHNTARRGAASVLIDDCIEGIDKISHCDQLIATPVNLGTSELMSIDDLVTMVEDLPP